MNLIPPPTDRLSFRKLNMQDVKAWEAFVLSEKAMEFFTFPREKEESEKWIHRQLIRYEKKVGGLLAVELKDSGEFIGQCGLLYQDVDGEQLWEVGYSFLPQFWGKGYASEAAAACFKHGFDIDIAPFLVSVIHIDNIASQKVAQHCGLQIWKEIIWKELPVQVWRVEA